jgi:hypothetical protein
MIAGGPNLHLESKLGGKDRVGMARDKNCKAKVLGKVSYRYYTLQIVDLLVWHFEEGIGQAKLSRVVAIGIGVDIVEIVVDGDVVVVVEIVVEIVPKIVAIDLN